MTTWAGGADRLCALEIDGLRWVIVAKIDAAEAFEPVTDFTRNIILATAAMIFLVCLASLILAQIFVRPVADWSPACGRWPPGSDVEVPVRSKDEFGDLGAAFNDMSRACGPNRNCWRSSRPRTTGCC